MKGHQLSCLFCRKVIVHSSTYKHYTNGSCGRQYYCDFCGKQFPEAKGLNGHRSSLHTHPKDISGDKNPAKRPEVRVKMGIASKRASQLPQRRAASMKNLAPKFGDANVSRRPDVRAKLKGMKKSELTKARMSASMTSERIAQSIRNSRVRKNCINKAEARLLAILQRQEPTSGWAFCGDGRLMIGRKCPDFVALNEPHRLVELFGEHCHKPEEIQSRTQYFTDHGYDCRVVWYRELNSLELREAA